MSDNSSCGEAKKSLRTQRWRHLGAATVAIGGTLAGTYALNLLRRRSKAQALLDALPPTVRLKSPIAVISKLIRKRGNSSRIDCD